MHSRFFFSYCTVKNNDWVKIPWHLKRYRFMLVFRQCTSSSHISLNFCHWIFESSTDSMHTDDQKTVLKDRFSILFEHLLCAYAYNYTHTNHRCLYYMYHCICRLYVRNFWQTGAKVTHLIHHVTHNDPIKPCSMSSYILDLSIEEIP